MNGPLSERRLQETWYGSRRPGLLLSALEQVYAGVSAARRQATRPDPGLEGSNIVVVGNITAGGTGKTPLVIRLCELLVGAGLSVAVISRGYGRKRSGPVRVTANTPPADAGDEPALIARRCAVPVFVDEDRESAAREAFADGARVILSDDGLQRTRLPRRMELCVVDAGRGFGNGRLLPAGPLRESVDRLLSVDWVISNGDAGSVAWPGGLAHPVVEMKLAPVDLRRLGAEEALPAAEIPEALGRGPVSAVAGMGHPDRFFATLESLGLEGFSRHPFPDHHDFGAEDFADVEGVILMTEKDAVKCEELELPNAWCLRVEASLPPEWEERWVRQVVEMSGD